MTSKNRRRIMVLGVLAALLLPTEAFLISTLRDGHRSVEDLWSKRLDDESRLAAARRLKEYPVAYRHALLRTLEESERIVAWQAVAETFLAQRSDLTESQRNLVNRVVAAEHEAWTLGGVPTSPALLSAAETVRVELGESAYRYLFVDAGPPDLRPAYQYSVLPLRTRLEAFVRAQAVRAEAECKCRMGLSLDCESGETCVSDANCKNTQDGCGIGKKSGCDGMCKKNEDLR